MLFQRNKNSQSFFPSDIRMLFINENLKAESVKSHQHPRQLPNNLLKPNVICKRFGPVKKCRISENITSI